MSRLEGDCAFANSSRMHPDHGQAITNATKPGSVHHGQLPAHEVPENTIDLGGPRDDVRPDRSREELLDAHLDTPPNNRTRSRLSSPDEPSASDDLPKHWWPRSHDHERDQPDQYATEQFNPVWTR